MKTSIIILILLFSQTYNYAQRVAFKTVSVKYIRMPSQPFPSSVKTYFSEIVGTTNMDRPSLVEEFLTLPQLSRVELQEKPDVNIQVDIEKGFTRGKSYIGSRVVERSDKSKINLYNLNFDYWITMCFSVSLKDTVLVRKNKIKEIAFQEYTSPEDSSENYVQNYYIEHEKGIIEKLETELMKKGLEIIRDYLDDRYSQKEVGEYFFMGKVEGNKHDYNDLDQAFAFLKAGIDKNNKGDIKSAEIDLENAMNIYKKALAESDLNDKNARINDKITNMIHYNLAFMYYLINDFENSEKHIGIALESTKGLSDEMSSMLSKSLADKKARYQANGLLK